ncbi:ABC transporter ATP-binding protein [Altererythrobacter sp. H2]|uniref:ABC transporter ATP-binding protein n=1 Tax=Altererythrobacter sp. H2 TaxID=3108391 RepID=UPI002B4C04C3|nr:ABC transporter ATP-binding protein [Altererythrobacter sp. H2]WRK96551.1 ABC transporter ATP-binding protein [Altererythrobacter sp. H2]
MADPADFRFGAGPGLVARPAMDATDPILELSAVTRRYGTVAAVDAAGFALQRGRIACLLGPSGCGKSTLLRMIAGLEPVDEGTIHLAGQVVSAPGSQAAPEHRGVGLVFQDNALFPHLDVRGNVGFGLGRLPRAQRETQVTRLLDQFHIAHLEKSWPHMLSGGEQQRVAIARALAREPALLLLDEPFSGLDGSLRASVRDALLADLRRAGATVLVVTHDPDEAMAIADDLVLMAGGRVLQTGSPDECYRRPVSVTAAHLLGDLVLLPGQVAAGQAETALGTHPAPGLPDGPVLIGLRPEALSLMPGGVPATVREVRFAGHGHRLRLDLGGTEVMLRLTGTPPTVGETVDVGHDPAAVRVFPG